MGLCKIVLLDGCNKISLKLNQTQIGSNSARRRGFKPETKAIFNEKGHMNVLFLNLMKIV